MAGYEDTKRLIIETLMGRPSETEIQPENHQAYALNMLEYIRSIELISGGSVIGIADEETVPVQPNDSRVSYISGIAQNRTMTFHNFIGQEGEALTVTTGDMECYLIILLWNTEYWSLQAIPSNIVSKADNAVFYYRYNIRKTYDSVSSMNADKDNPIGIDGKPINIGDIVSVVNSSTSSENAIYSRIENDWQFQSGMNFALVQTTGSDVNSAMSQKAVTDFVNSEIGKVDQNYKQLSNSVDGIKEIVPSQLRKLIGEIQITNDLEHDKQELFDLFGVESVSGLFSLSSESKTKIFEDSEGNRLEYLFNGGISVVQLNLTYKDIIYNGNLIEGNITVLASKDSYGISDITSVTSNQTKKELTFPYVLDFNLIIKLNQNSTEENIYNALGGSEEFSHEKLSELLSKMVSYSFIIAKDSLSNVPISFTSSSGEYVLQYEYYENYNSIKIYQDLGVFKVKSVSAFNGFQLTVLGQYINEVNAKASQTYENLDAIKNSNETNTNKIYIDGETGQFYIYKNGQFVPSKGGDDSNKILDWNTDVATTRKQIPLSDRKSGLQISYNRPNYGWINEQYIGTSFTDSEWVKDYRWEKIVKFDFINGFNNFYSFLNYGIYNNSESKVRIKISESDEEGNFNISFSRNVAHNDDTRIRVMDKEIIIGHSFSYTCDTKFTKQDTIYIYVGLSKFQISLTPYLPSTTSDSQIYSFICILFWDSLKSRWTIIDSNNIFCYDNTIVNSYYYYKRVDIRMFGLSPYIEGISTENDKYDMAPQLNLIFKLAFNMGIKDLYFPSGIYYIGSTLRFNYDLNYRALRSGEVIFKKLDEDVSVSIEDNFAEGGYYGFVFENTYLNGFYNYDKTNVNVVYDTIIINYPSFSGSAYLFRRKHSDDKAHITFRNVKVNVQKTYVCFWAGSNTIIENCEFTGQATHVIRLDGVENCIVQNNYIYGNNCTTGIFFGSNRDKINRNVNIKNNFVSGCTEECISMDGFGNNAGLYPNLAQGNISSVYLDEKGLLVVEVYNLITPASSAESKEVDIPTLITKKDDVIFYFGRDTGIDGQYFSILSMEELEGNCKVTLKTKGISTDKILTGDSTIIGFLTGFLDCNIDGNIIENSYGINDTAINAVAISLWLNIFGVNIINNRIIGTSRGIMVSGGSGLTGTYLYASNNLIANNKISACKSNAIEVENGYGGIFNYNNSVVNNTIAYCGGLSLKGQRNLLFVNNMIKGTQINATYLDNTFISSNMFDDVTFTESDNGENYVKQNNFENS